MNACSDQPFGCVKEGTTDSMCSDSHTLDRLKVKAWRKTLAIIAHNWRTRSRLKTLNESQLKDIGLSAADVDHETRKPLWK